MVARTNGRQYQYAGILNPYLRILMSGWIFTYPQASSGRHHAVSRYSLFLSSQKLSYMCEGVQMFPGLSITLCLSLCRDLGARVPRPPPRGFALCWRQRCPGASRLHWGSAPPGPDTAPTHTSSSSPSPGQMWREVQTKAPSSFLVWCCFPSDLSLMHEKTWLIPAQWHQHTD